MDAGIESGKNALVERAKAMILRPKEEWPRIETEPATQTDILKGYVLPLAAIGPVAHFIGSQVFGHSFFFARYRPPLITSLVTAIISFIMAIVAVFVLMFIADFLASKFSGQSNRTNAFKLVAYGATAAWLAGIFGLIPALSVFGLLGLYSFYLFYTGVTPLMKVPQEKAAAYTAVTFICAVVLMLIVAPITAGLTTMMGFGAANLAADTDSGGTVTLPGGKSLDLGQIEKMGQQVQDAANGKTPPIQAAKLQALLPSSIGSYQRTATETLAAGPMGSTATGTYTSGDNSFTLSVADMSALGALAGLGAAMGVEQTRQDANGYERTQTVDGQMQTESWDKTNNSGKFGRMVASRFMVEADGHADSIDQLKEAVANVDPDDLTDMVQ